MDRDPLPSGPAPAPAPLPAATSDPDPAPAPDTGRAPGRARETVLGIDIGGSGIKGARVDVERGVLATERLRVATPVPSTPDNVARAVAEIVVSFGYDGPIGLTFPAVVRHGRTLTAANVDDAWIGADARTLFARTTGLPVHLMNDADAAGVAEMAFGAGRDEAGTVLVVTLGTGIGTALFIDGRLVPNTEFGHVEMGGREAESYAADRVRKDEDLSWKRWGRRVSEVLRHLEGLLSPDLFILGGGVSKKFDKFERHLEVDARVLPAALRNEAGIVGAALTVHRGGGARGG